MVRRNIFTPSSARVVRGDRLLLGSMDPGPKEVAAAQANQARPVPQATATPAGPFTSFADLPRAYLGGRFDLQEWAQYWQGVVTTGHVDAFDHCDGIYEFRSDLGGATAMRRGVAGVERDLLGGDLWRKEE